MEVKISITGSIEEILDVLVYIRTRKPNLVVADTTEYVQDEPVVPATENPAPEGELINRNFVSVCQECKQPFQHIKEGAKFCSKKCNQRQYMRTWYQNKAGKAAVADPLKEKLEKIKKTCPAPKKRPEITRDIF